MRSSSSSSASRVWIGLATKASAPECEGALARLVGGDDADRDVPGGRSFLSRSSTRQPSMSGRQMSSVMASGLYSRVRARAAAPERRDQPLEALLAGHVQQEAGEAQVVLDDQQHPVAGLDVVAVVADFVDRAIGGASAPARDGVAAAIVGRDAADRCVAPAGAALAAIGGGSAAPRAATACGRRAACRSAAGRA